MMIEKVTLCNQKCAEYRTHLVQIQTNQIVMNRTFQEE